MQNPNENDIPESTELEVVPINALEATERASIDVQISTAKRYPRSLEKYKKNAIAMATFDEEVAESCLYRRPVGKEKDPKTGEFVTVYAEGMSVRMSEIVGANYGNIRVKAYLVEQTERFVRACGQAIDLESNYASSSEVAESTVDKQGRPYSERQRLLTAKIALSKARRDALFQVVPRAIAKPIENACRGLLFANQLSIDQRRARVVSWIGKLGIDPARVYASLGIKGESELTKEHLETLTGVRNAIKDGDTKIDEAFPDPKAQAPKAGLADVIGKPATPSSPASGQQAPSSSVATANTTPPSSEPAPDRDALLKACEDAMLAAETGETRVLRYARENLGAKSEHDELGSLPTDILARLLPEIPNIKKATK